LTGAAITVLAFAEPFIAAGAAVAFWSFFATEKELGPRGYERNEIMNCLVTPSIMKTALCEWKKHCLHTVVRHNIQFRLILVF
jgi:hypothetical protein